MSDPIRGDEDLAEELLEVLKQDEPEPPDDLPERTLRTVRTLLTARELIDMTTFVFLMRFCVPILELVASLISGPPDRRETDDD